MNKNILAKISPLSQKKEDIVKKAARLAMNRLYPNVKISEAGLDSIVDRMKKSAMMVNPRGTGASAAAAVKNSLFKKIKTFLSGKTKSLSGALGLTEMKEGFGDALSPITRKAKQVARATGNAADRLGVGDIYANTAGKMVDNLKPKATKLTGDALQHAGRAGEDLVDRAVAQLKLTRDAAKAERAIFNQNVKAQIKLTEDAIGAFPIPPTADDAEKLNYYKTLMSGKAVREKRPGSIKATGAPSTPEQAVAAAQASVGNSPYIRDAAELKRVQ